MEQPADLLDHRVGEEGQGNGMAREGAIPREVSPAVQRLQGMLRSDDRGDQPLPADKPIAREADTQAEPTGSVSS